MFADLAMPARAYAVSAAVVALVVVALTIRYVLPPIVRYLRRTLDDDAVVRARLDTAARLSDRKEQSL